MFRDPWDPGEEQSSQREQEEQRLWPRSIFRVCKTSLELELKALWVTGEFREAGRGQMQEGPVGADTPKIEGNHYIGEQDQ